MSLKRKTELMRLRYEKCLNSKVYKDPYQKINDYYMQIEKFIKTLENSSIKKLKDCKLESAKVITKLDALSPLKTLSRGYCVTEVDDKVITKASDLKKDMQINIKFYDGNVNAKVL